MHAATAVEYKIKLTSNPGRFLRNQYVKNLSTIKPMPHHNSPCLGAFEPKDMTGKKTNDFK